MVSEYTTIQGGALEPSLSVGCLMTLYIYHPRDRQVYQYDVILRGQRHILADYKKRAS